MLVPLVLGLGKVRGGLSGVKWASLMRRAVGGYSMDLANPAPHTGRRSRVHGNIMRLDCLAEWGCPFTSPLSPSAQLNPRYIPQLQAVLTMPQSIGIVGGRPGSSLYFVGTQQDLLLYLDPHEVQEVRCWAGVLECVCIEGEWSGGRRFPHWDSSGLGCWLTVFSSSGFLMW